MQRTGKLLTTAQVCRELGLTPAKVKRLTREGYLEVSGKSTHKHGEAHLFHPVQVSCLKEQVPKILSKWATEENAVKGAQRAGINRAVEVVIADEVKKRRDDFISSLAELPEKTANLLEASFYLYHLNHYAKSGHEYLYDIKEKVLRHIVKKYFNTPHLQVVLVQGQQKVDLCQNCRLQANKLNISYGEYAKSFGGCPRCRKYNSYYDLYELNIRYDNHQFSFHTPYSAARKWFSPEMHIPRQYRGYRQEQGLTFGRPIREREARALPMDEVIDKLLKILEKN